MLRDGWIGQLCAICSANGSTDWLAGPRPAGQGKKGWRLSGLVVRRAGADLPSPSRCRGGLGFVTMPGVANLKAA